MITRQDLIAFTKGKKDGFDKVYHSYAPGMYAICLRYLRSEDDAKDALQETFIKIFEARSTYNIDQPIGAWIKTVTIRTALNLLRVRQRFVLTEDELGFNNAIEPTYEELDPENFKRSLQIALDQLPDGYRIVFSLFAIENLKHKEIAEYLDITEGTSKSQYAKARKMLQQLLQKERIAS